MQLLTTRRQVEAMKARSRKLMSYLSTSGYTEQCDIGNTCYYVKSQPSEKASTTQLLNIEQVLWVLQIGRSTLYNLINQRKLTAVKIGDRTLFRPQDLEEFINKLNQYGD